MTDTTGGKNSSAPPALAQTVTGEERFDLNPGGLVRDRAEIDAARKPALAEVFTGECSVGASIDRPIKRFANPPAFRCRCASRWNQETRRSRPIGTGHRHIRHIKNRDIFEPQY